MSGKKTIIIGSGVAAVAVARRILTNNSSANVHILEAGGDLSIPNHRKWLDFVMTGISPTRVFRDKVGDADINTTGGFSLRGGRLIVKGGSTNHWSGSCPRMKPEDFHLGDVRPNSINWAIEYHKIALYYTQAEAFLHVCGNSNSITVPRFGGKYPYEAVPFTALDKLLIPTLVNLNYEYDSLPVARNPNRCYTTGTCIYCPFDARYAAGSDINHLISQFGNRVSLQINTPVLSIEMRDKKTASGVHFFDKNHQRKKIHLL